MQKREFKLAGKVGAKRLFPVPVIEDQKFLIESSVDKEAELLKEFLNRGWLTFTLLSPEDCWQEFEKHTDGRTRRFLLKRSELHLSYMPKRQDDLKKSKSLEAVVRRAFTAWHESGFESGEALEHLKNKISAQKACRVCQQLGVEELDFSFVETAE